MTRAPLVLIVSQHEWASRSLDSVITPKGYAVLRAYTAQQAMERAERNDPDAIFIDMTLPEMSGAELTQQLLERDLVSKAAPILLMASGHVSRDERIRALEGGAWEVLTLPLDAEELLLRIERYIRGKLQADRLRDDALVDALTGLYSWHGVSRRISEIAAAAERYGRPLSCIVVGLGSDTDEEGDEVPREVSEIAERLRASVRSSDILARIGPQEFAIIAPDTASDGANILASRLREMSAGSAPDVSSRVRAGVYAVDNLKGSELDPADFLLRASRAAYDNRSN